MFKLAMIIPFLASCSLQENTPVNEVADIAKYSYNICRSGDAKKAVHDLALEKKYTIDLQYIHDVSKKRGYQIYDVSIDGMTIFNEDCLGFDGARPLYQILVILEKTDKRRISYGVYADKNRNIIGIENRNWYLSS